MKLALAQLEIESGAVETNVEQACEAIRSAANGGADLVVLPELFTVGYFAFDAYARSAEGLDGPILSRIGRLAREEGVYVLAGSVVEDLAATAAIDGTTPPAGDGLANTAVLFDASGQRQAVYRKRHLFGYDSQEATLLTPGESAGIADVGDFRLGITTCYDLRFPEQYRRLLDRSVDLFVVVSAWPYPRLEHWQTLPRARAIENLAYVATVNGTGAFDDATLLGRSTLYDPWGTPVAAAGEGPTIVFGTLDPSEIERVRESFPALEDCRA
jgi:predicted amidohydrolase